MRGLLRGCGTLIGVVVLVLIGLFVYGRFNPATQAQPAASSQAAPTSGAPAAAPDASAVEARLTGTESRIRQDAATGKHEPISVTITDPELNALVADGLARDAGQVPVTGVQAASVPGQVNVSGQAKAGVLSAPFTMVAVPQVSGGKAQLHVNSVSFGGLPIPQAIGSQLTNAVSSDNLLGDVPLTVTSFRAEQGRLVLEGTT